MNLSAPHLRRLAVYPLAASTALALTGCAASFDDQPFADWIERDQATWQTDNGSTRHDLQSLPTTATGVTLDDDVPAGTGPDDYVRLAMERNPELLSARYRVGRIAQRVPQATSLDDPMLTVTPIGEMAETAAGQVGLMSGISQKLPLPQKLNARGNIARGDVAIAGSDWSRRGCGSSPTRVRHFGATTSPFERWRRHAKAETSWRVSALSPTASFAPARPRRPTCCGR